MLAKRINGPGARINCLARLSRVVSSSFIPVVGCQRSGTTLVYLMLRSHPDTRGLDEDEANWQLPQWHKVLRWRLRGLRAVYKLPTSSVRIATYRSCWPKSKVVWPVRHPLTTISSMNKLGNQAGAWLRSHGYRQLRQHGALFGEEVAPMKSFQQPTMIGAELWKYKLRTLRLFRRTGMDVFVLKFEELLESPLCIGQALVKFVGLQWDDRLLEHHRYAERKAHPGGTAGDKPLDPSRAHATVDLSQREIGRIKGFLWDEMSSLGYS